MQKTFRTGLAIGLAVAVAVIAGAWTYIRYDANTLRKVRARGELLCGVNTGLPGFSNPDAQGTWSGFDVDFCRALAAAIFDDPKKVKFVPLDASERFRELRDRKVDVLARNSTWNLSRELRPALRGGVVLRRARLYGAPVEERRHRTRTRRQQDLHADRNDDATQSR